MNETRNETTDASLGAERCQHIDGRPPPCRSPRRPWPAKPTRAPTKDCEPRYDGSSTRTAGTRPPGSELLTEIRCHAVRAAAHIAAKTGVRNDRALVDDVVTAAWLVAVNHREQVITAEHPWAYLLQSAQRHALDEVRAQQLLTSPTRVRGASRATLPSVLRRVGSTAHDLAVAFRHEAPGRGGDTAEIRLPGRRARDGLPTFPDGATASARHGWYDRLVALLVEHGANRAVTIAVLDRLADLMTSTAPATGNAQPATTEPSRR